MTKFKVGDIVVGNQDNEINGVEQGQLYEVVATEAEGGYDYIQTNSSLGCWVLSERFDLYKAVPYVEQDDPLPPAPESVSYYNSYINQLGNDQHLVLVKDNKNHPDEGLMYLGIVPRTGSTRANDEIGINLDPDAALQLAHDLNRMANEIKRRERAQNGE